MKQSEILTAAAVGLALFALWFVTKGPGKGTVTRPNDDRAITGAAWFNTLGAQYATINGYDLPEHRAFLQRLGATA